MVMTARHLAKRAPSAAVLGEPLAKPVEAFRHLLAGRAGEGLGAAVDLDPGNDPLARQDLDQRRPVVGLLAEASRRTG